MEKEVTTHDPPGGRQEPATTDPMKILEVIEDTDSDQEARGFIRRCLRLARKAGRREAARRPKFVGGQR